MGGGGGGGQVEPPSSSIKIYSPRGGDDVNQDTQADQISQRVYRTYIIYELSNPIYNKETDAKGTCTWLKSQPEPVLTCLTILIFYNPLYINLYHVTLRLSLYNIYLMLNKPLECVGLGLVWSVVRLIIDLDRK